MTSARDIPKADFTFVRYANCWEDAALLVKALRPASGRRVLSIASAGDNSLSLLAGGADVVAADLNPAQLACAELRKEAIRALDHAAFLRFSGVEPCSERVGVYQSLRPELSVAAREFWDRRTNILRDGLIHGGKFERYFKLFRTRLLPLVHSERAVRELLRPKEVGGRREFYRNVWNNRRWNLLFRVFFSRFVMGRLGRDPSFFRHVQGSVSERLLSRARYALTELDTASNPYLSYILTGAFRGALPHYLLPENYRAIRQRIGRLTLRQGAIDAVAEELGAEGFDGFNLSDIFEYLSPEQSANVYARLVRHARPGARLAYWNMLVPRRCPPELSGRVVALEHEANELFAQDQAFFYSRFVLEEVR